MEEEVIVEKLWGAERWLYNGYDYCMKELYIEQGAKSSLHMHKIKKETFLVTFGSVKIEVGTKLLHLHVGDFVTIEPGTYHRFWTDTKMARVVEASTYHDDSDVYRKEESYRWMKKPKPQ